MNHTRLWLNLTRARACTVKAEPLRGALRAALTAARFG